MSRRVHIEVEPLPFREPLRIAGRVFAGIPAVRTMIKEDGHSGRGEAGGVFFLNDDTDHMIEMIDGVREEVAKGAGRAELRQLLPPCGARNALDAALWELESHQTGLPVWRLAGLKRPQPQVTTFTLGADPPEQLLRTLDSYGRARAIKLKLDGDIDGDRERLKLIRGRRPDIWLMVDANQGYSVDLLEQILPSLVEAQVKVIEQPVPRGGEAALMGMNSPIPLAADESLLGLDELPSLIGIFKIANIKLDKCGGLTEALMMVKQARSLGLDVMVGNMGGSSYAAAPAYLLAQLCDYVDLDGPAFLACDVQGGASYSNGRITLPDGFWGSEDCPLQSQTRP